MGMESFGNIRSKYQRELLRKRLKRLDRVLSRYLSNSMRGCAGQQSYPAINAGNEVHESVIAIEESPGVDGGMLPWHGRVLWHQLVKSSRDAARSAAELRDWVRKELR